MTVELNEAIRQRDALFNCLMVVRDGIRSGSIANPLTFSHADMNQKSLKLRPLSVLIDEAVAACGYKLIDPPQPEKKKRKPR